MFVNVGCSDGFSWTHGEAFRPERRNADRKGAVSGIFFALLRWTTSDLQELGDERR